MRRLRAPLRLTWDWDWPPVARPGGRAPRRPLPEAVRLIGAEIVRAQVLLLEVGYPDAAALAGGELAAALAGFSGALSLVVTPETAAQLGGERSWELPGVAETWLDATPQEGAPAPAPPAGWPTVRWYLTAANLEAVAAGLVGAVESGARALSLPNLPLFGEALRRARELAPRPEHLRRFADLVAPALLAAPGVDLRVHHYGLWQELRARGLAPQGEEAAGHAGCQAGAALAYLDPAGILYPCASLPIPLARVGEGTLGEVWAGGELAGLREQIAALPGPCAGCAHEAGCRGGCRGWAHYLAGSWSATGPDCLR